MVASIGKIASPAHGVGYFEKDGCYAKNDAAHKDASAWAGKGAAAPGLEGPVDPDAFRRVLEGDAPGGRRLGRMELDGSVTHRPFRDVTLSAPKCASLMAMVGGGDRIVAAHDKAVANTLGWIERNAVETRMRDPATGAMVRAGNQKMVAATFRHDPETIREIRYEITRYAAAARRRAWQSLGPCRDGGCRSHVARRALGPGRRGSAGSAGTLRCIARRAGPDRDRFPPGRSRPGRSRIGARGRAVAARVPGAGRLRGSGCGRALASPGVTTRG